MKLRKRSIAVVLAVGLVGVFTLGAGASGASADTVQFKAFLNAGQTAPILIVPNKVRFNAQCSATQDLSAQMVSRSNNLIGKVGGTTEGGGSYNNSRDELDVGEHLDLLDGPSTEVTAQADAMTFGGGTIVNANYSTEDGGSPNAGAVCTVWGSADVFGG